VDRLTRLKFRRSAKKPPSSIAAGFGLVRTVLDTPESLVIPYRVPGRDPEGARCGYLNIVARLNAAARVTGVIR